MFATELDRKHLSYSSWLANCLRHAAYSIQIPGGTKRVVCIWPVDNRFTRSGSKRIHSRRRNTNRRRCNCAPSLPRRQFRAHPAWKSNVIGCQMARLAFLHQDFRSGRIGGIYPLELKLNWSTRLRVGMGRCSANFALDACCRVSANASPSKPEPTLT